MSPAKRLRLYLPPLMTSKSTSLFGPISPRAAEPKRIIFSGAATFTMRRIISLSFLWSTVVLRLMFCRPTNPILPFPYSLPERLSLVRVLHRVRLECEPEEGPHGNQERQRRGTSTFGGI